MNQKEADKPLYLSVILNGSIFFVELTFGFITNSLALISDAFHNLTDLLAVFIALISRLAGRKPPTLKHTYGFRRVEIFAAFFNALILFALMAFLLRESILRLLTPINPPKTLIVFLVASFAFLVNFASALLLHSHRKDDVNIKIAFVHMCQDALVSLIVVVSSFLYTFSFGKYVDPIATILVSIFVIKSTISIFWETIRTLLEGVPYWLNIKEISDFVESKYPEVSIHHIHLWQNGPNEILMTAHIQIKDESSISMVEKLFTNLKTDLEEKWKITHITLEPEVNGCEEKGLISNSHQN